MRLNRSVIRVSRLGSEEDQDYVPLSLAERLAFVWELTQEVFSFSGAYDVKSRLQRNVVRLTRRGR